MSRSLTLIWAGLVILYLITFNLKVLSYKGFVTSHCGDLLSLPVILIPMLATWRKLTRNPCYSFSIGLIFSVVVYQTLIFEFILPRISQRYTYDPWDIAAYAIGAVCFSVIQFNFAGKAATEKCQLSNKS